MRTLIHRSLSHAVAAQLLDNISVLTDNFLLLPVVGLSLVFSFSRKQNKQFCLWKSLAIWTRQFNEADICFCLGIKVSDSTSEDEPRLRGSFSAYPVVIGLRIMSNYALPHL